MKISPDKAILLVEDNPDDIELTKRAFMKNNLLNPIVVAEDGAAALDYLFGRGTWGARDVTDRPALVLLDLKLPKIEGIEVLRQIREDDRSRTIPVVILTTSREDRDVVESYRLGANSYVRKPVDFNDFIEAVKNLGMYWLLLNEAPPA